MPRPLFILAVIPAVAFIVLSFLPASLKEPYAWLDPISLNTPAANGRSRRWFNMGHWEGTVDFSEAAEQLGRKLLEFANAPEGGSVLDIAHGSGESLLLHLSNPLRAQLDALASLPADTARARSLVFSYKINNTVHTPVEFFTASAVPQFGKVADQSHPLNPMRGFLGRSGGSAEEDDELEADHDEGALHIPAPDSKKPTSGYNLIYVLDAIYHFPPSLSSFLTLAQQSLAPEGVVAYTDLLPPTAGLNPIIARLLSMAMGVPLPNLISRPRTLAAYTAELEALGFEDVRVEDWSADVWPGFAANLRGRGGAWAYVGKIVDHAAKEGGWKFLAVRARRQRPRE